MLFENLSPKWFPKWLVHALSNRFLNTDTWLHDVERLVRTQEKYVDVNNVYVSSSSSDIGVKAFRIWWSANGMANAPPHAFGPATKEQLGPRVLTRREQIDPWVHHTKHCAGCRKALKSWKRAEKLSLALSFVFAAVFGAARKQSVLAVLLSLAALGAHYCSKNVATIMEGNPYPSGVADRSVAAMKE